MFERTGRNRSYYPRVARSLKFNGNTDFQTELRRRMDEHFRTMGRPQRGGWRMYLKSGIILSCFFLSYIALVFWAQNSWQGLVLALLLALSMTTIGFNITHDGGHRAFSERKLGQQAGGHDAGPDRRQLLCVALEARHHIITTTSTLVGYDPDIELGKFTRFAPHQKRRWFHRWQHLYVWALYAFLVVRFQLYSDFHALLYGRIHAHPTAPAEGREPCRFHRGEGAFFYPGVRAAAIRTPRPGCPLLLRGSCPHYGHTAFRRLPVAALHGPFRLSPCPTKIPIR